MDHLASLLGIPAALLPLLPLRRFLVFAGQVRLEGGWNEFRGSHKLQSEAEAMASYLVDADSPFIWAQVVDMRLEKVVKRYETA